LSSGDFTTSSPALSNWIAPRRRAWPPWLSEDRGDVAFDRRLYVNDKRVERIWRRKGLKVPAKQSKQGRIWLADGSCIRLRAERPNHVWSYDFVGDRAHNGIPRLSRT
jgi:hypothetical protein